MILGEPETAQGLSMPGCRNGTLLFLSHSVGQSKSKGDWQKEGEVGAEWRWAKGGKWGICNSVNKNKLKKILESAQKNEGQIQGIGK